MGENNWSGPDSVSIRKALSQTGISHLILKQTALAKDRPNIQIDLNAIAKGYGVDKVAQLIEKYSSNYLVEIGGEVKCSGFNNGNAWIIGIEQPELSPDKRTIKMAIPLKNQALATSGDYRRFFKYNNKIYSHVIDPRTGYPAESNIASATVLASTCMEADAIATALMVLGVEDGLSLIKSLENVEAMLMVREENKKITLRMSEGFPE